MLVFLITDQNFDQIKARREKTLAGLVTKLAKSKKRITISTNTMAPFAIFKWEQDGHFAISNRLDEIENYIATLGFKLIYAPVDSQYVRHKKPYVDKSRNCANVEKITQWNQVEIDRQGALRITLPKTQLYSVDLTSPRGIQLLLKWLKKYLIIAIQQTGCGNFIPTLTGGLDTRTLTWFWRDWYRGSDYYLNAIKPNGLHDVTRGQGEVESATQVLQRLGKSFDRLENTDHRVTFSGLFTENSQMPNEINDSSFIYDFVALHFGACSKHDNKYFNYRCICPFVDNLYLSLKHPELDYMRTLLALLLCPDLLDVTLYSFDNKPPYNFNQKFANLIPKVEELIQQYNLRKRVKKLKTRVARFAWYYRLKCYLKLFCKIFR